MTPHLRRRHAIIWIVLAVCFPLLIIGTVLDLSPLARSTPDHVGADPFEAAWKDGSQLALVIAVIEPMLADHLLAYLEGPAGEPRALLGLLGERRTYQFDISQALDPYDRLVVRNASQEVIWSLALDQLSTRL